MKRPAKKGWTEEDMSTNQRQQWEESLTDEIDEDILDDEEDDGWDECGRWLNGRLSLQCTKAGSEECDWHCPIGLPRRRTRNPKARG